MKYEKMSITDMQEALKDKTKDPDRFIKKAISLANKYQKEYNSFVTLYDIDNVIKGTSGPLSGIPYAIKDNYSTKGYLTTGSSNILKNYVPVFDATVVTKLKQSGASAIGKTVLDELAMGGTGTTGHTGPVYNPWDKRRLIGGSSAGSAAAVALGIVPFALGSDTGDSVRKPAALGGIVGFKPTYGLISRYGLFPFASSLDHVGIFARNVKDVTIVTDLLKGHDEKEMTSLKDDGKVYTDTLNNDVKGRKLFYFKEACERKTFENSDDIEYKTTMETFFKTIEECRKIGIEVDEVSFDIELLEAIFPVYFSISCAEATSNNANLTGIPFGSRIDGKNYEELMIKTRTEGFSELIKRRFIIGSFILQKENQEKLFRNAGRVRRMIVDKMHELFKEYDGLIMPASSGVAPFPDSTSDKLSDRYLILENHLAIGNFGGFPSITIPNGFVNGLPIAINITGEIKTDDVVLNIANKIEEQLGFKGIVAKESEEDV